LGRGPELAKTERGVIRKGSKSSGTLRFDLSVKMVNFSLD
jgi:hypothetical protein